MPLKKYDVSFAFPSSSPAAETEYTEHLFYYNLRSPIKTARSVFTLARAINKEYDRVIIFSQGIFSAYLTMLLNRRIEVVAWGHELINHVESRFSGHELFSVRSFDVIENR